MHVPLGSVTQVRGLPYRIRVLHLEKQGARVRLASVTSSWWTWGKHSASLSFTFLVCEMGCED